MKRRFSEVLAIINGRNQKKVENPQGKYPIYGSGGIMGHADDYLCEENTVIIGRKGNINKPLFVKEKFWNVDTAFGLAADCKLLHPKYLYYFCCQYDFERLNKTVTIPSLTKSDLLEIELELPPLKEQEEVAAKLEQVDLLIDKCRQRIEIFDMLVKSRFIEMFGDPVLNPMGWEIKPLLEMGDCKNGMNFRKDESGIELNCLGVGDFQNLSVISDTSALPTVSLNAMLSKEYLLENEEDNFA